MRRFLKCGWCLIGAASAVLWAAVAVFAALKAFGAIDLSWWWALGIVVLPSALAVPVGVVIWLWLRRTGGDASETTISPATPHPAAATPPTKR